MVLMGQIEIVRRTRGYRRWPDDVKARIVAESFQPGVRVADVARHHVLAAHQLSDWRRQARLGLLALPAEMMAGVVEDKNIESAFVPVMVAPEEEGKSPGDGSITIEFGGGVMMRVPGDVPDDRVMALVRALRSASSTGSRPRPRASRASQNWARHLPTC
jgi:transposase